MGVDLDLPRWDGGSLTPNHVGSFAQGLSLSYMIIQVITSIFSQKPPVETPPTLSYNFATGWVGTEFAQVLWVPNSPVLGVLLYVITSQNKHIWQGNIMRDPSHTKLHAIMLGWRGAICPSLGQSDFNRSLIDP